MNPGTEQRKLAAILFTDLVGYPDVSGAQRAEDRVLVLTILQIRRKWSP